MAVGSQVKAFCALVDAVGGLGVAGSEFLRFKGDKGECVLAQAGAHRLCEFEATRRFLQKRLGQLQIERTGLARQTRVFLDRRPLTGKLIAQALNDQVARRAGTE